jgi:hypothetical protein
VKYALAIPALLLALAAPAQARIVPQRSIAGVRLDMTQAQVRAAAGEPSAVERGRNDFGPFTQFVYRGKRLTVTFQGDDAVTAVATTSRAERTRSGVGAGSSERAVRRGVRGVQCETFFRIRSCHVGSFTAGRKVTDFLMRRGRVARVTLGYVID